jgi:hypothetical protein
MVWLSYYCRPAVELKQKTHRRSAVGFVKSLERIKTQLPRSQAAARS